MGSEGFEPPKAVPADLQSAPVGHFGNCPGKNSAPFDKNGPKSSTCYSPPSHMLACSPANRCDHYNGDSACCQAFFITEIAPAVKHFFPPPLRGFPISADLNKGGPLHSSCLLFGERQWSCQPSPPQKICARRRAHYRKGYKKTIKQPLRNEFL